MIGRQLGRPPRALVGVAHRCPCGQPDVVETAPRLEDGTPFPTLYYLTCPRANAAASRLESAGRMREWQDPEYVRIQARDRLFYVRPGEVPLLVLDDPAGAARDAGKPLPNATPDSWYDTLWGSVEAANAEPRR